MIIFMCLIGPNLVHKINEQSHKYEETEAKTGAEGHDREKRLQVIKQ